MKTTQTAHNHPTGEHTPGPWGTNELFYAVIPILTVSAHGIHGMDCLATVDGRDREERRANARLIASAPDLLALARHILAMADDAYLTGHPEWQASVEEAQNIQKRVSV